MKKYLINAIRIFTIALILAMSQLSHAAEYNDGSNHSYSGKDLKSDCTNKPLTILITNTELEKDQCYFDYKSSSMLHPMGITVFGQSEPGSFDESEHGNRISVFFPEKGNTVEVTYRGSRAHQFSIVFFFANNMWKQNDDSSPGVVFYGDKAISTLSNSALNVPSVEEGNVSRVHISLCKDPITGIVMKVIPSLTL